MSRHVKYWDQMQIFIVTSNRWANANKSWKIFSLNFFLRQLFITHEVVKSNKKFYVIFIDISRRMRFQSAAS